MAFPLHLFILRGEDIYCSQYILSSSSLQNLGSKPAIFSHFFPCEQYIYGSKQSLWGERIFTVHRYILSFTSLHIPWSKPWISTHILPLEQYIHGSKQGVKAIIGRDREHTLTSFHTKSQNLHFQLLFSLHFKQLYSLVKPFFCIYHQMNPNINVNIITLSNPKTTNGRR